MKKKIYKLMSVLLSVVIVLSVCLIGMSVSADTVNIYVSNSGSSSNNGQESSPLMTVEEAINLAKNQGYGEGDTVNIIALNSGVMWGSTATPSHEFQLKITSNLTKTPKIYADKGTKIGGDTVFGNIAIQLMGQYPELFLNGYDVTFESESSIAGNYGYLIFGDFNNTYPGQNVVLKGAVSLYAIKVGGDGNTTYTDDVNILIDNPNTNFQLAFGNNYGYINYSNVNITVNSANEVKLMQEAGGDKSAFAAGCGLTVFNNTNTNIASTVYCLNENNHWIINNVVKDAGFSIVPSATLGSFDVTVPDGAQIQLQKPDMSTEMLSTGTIAIPGGVSTVESYRDAETKEFYVKHGADEATADGSKEHPFASVGKVVEAAKAYGLTKKDTAVAKLLPSDYKIAWGSFSNYVFTLVVDSEDITKKATVSIPSNTLLTGDTVFENVTIDGGAFESAFLYNNKNVTFGSGCYSNFRYQIFSTVGTVETVPGPTVVYKNAVGGYQIKVAGDFNGVNYTDAVDITVDNAGAAPSFTLSGNGGTANYQDINFNIKNASSFAIRYAINNGFVINGAVQIINSSSVDIGIDDYDLAKIASNKKYILNNRSGEKELIQFTDTVGTYKIVSEYDVTIIPADGSPEIHPTDEYVTLAPGVYEINVDKPAVTVDYYVSPSGVEVLDNTRPEGVGTKENPVKTIADATRLISQDPLRKVDTARVILNGGETISWGSGGVTLAPTFIIQTQGSDNNAVILSHDNLHLTTDTIFKDVTISIPDEGKALFLNNRNVTFDEGSVVAVKYVILGGVNGGSVDKDITIVFKGHFSPQIFKLASDFGYITYNKDINLICNSYSSSPSFHMVSSGVETVTYNGNINVSLIKASGFNVTTSQALDLNGALNLLINSNLNLPYSMKEKIEALDFESGKWFVTNYSEQEDFVKFGSVPGTIEAKDGKTLYVRDTATNTETKYTDGIANVPSGTYFVSDKETPEYSDKSHKMLYFRQSGDTGSLHTWTLIEPGVTYRFEYSIYSTRYEDMMPQVRHDGDRYPISGGVQIISEEKVGNHYNVVCEFTVDPNDQPYGQPVDRVFVGFYQLSYDEGYAFDMCVYRKDDPTRTSVMLNNDLHNGLDYWALQWDFWGFTSPGKTEVETDAYAMKVVDYDLALIDKLINELNPNDGEWWNEDQIVEEDIVITYGKAKGTFKENDGTPVSNVKMALISDDNKYTAITNDKGEFDFGDVITSYYELYIIDANGKEIFTGLAQFIEKEDVVTFNVTTKTTVDSSADAPLDNEYSDNSDYTTIGDGENVEEITPIGRLSGTVYTPYLETVSDLKVYLEGIDTEVITDANGNFAFGDVPVGEYELYTLLADGSKYVFRKVNIEENIDLAVKLKYDPSVASNTDNADNGWIIWVIIASVIALVVVAGLIFFLVFKKKKTVA